MNAPRFALAVVLLAVSAAPASAAGRKIYVSMSASAGGSGAQYSPFKTIGGGLYYLRNPGDELIVSKGLYIGSLTIKDLKGTAAAPIVIRGLREDVPAEAAARPHFSPAEFAPLVRGEKGSAITVSNCSYLVIEGLVVTGAEKMGVSLEGCDHVTVRNCDVVDNPYTQVQARGGSEITIEQCVLAGSAVEHGCHLWMCDKPQVRSCRIYENAMAGVYVHADKPSGGDGLIDGAIVEGNILYANGRPRPGAPAVVDEKGRAVRPGRLRFGAAAVSCDGMEQGIVRNNVIHHNYQGGIVLYRETASRAGVKSAVAHNTVYLPPDTGGAYGIYLALMSQGETLYNNIVVTAKAPAIWLGAGATRDMTSDYNVLFRLDGNTSLKRNKDELTLKRWQEMYRMDRNSLEFAPTFVDPDNEDRDLCDFKLKADSSLAGRGVFRYQAPADLLGQFRRRDRVTPGAYELSPASQPVSEPAHAHHRSKGQPKPPDQPTPPQPPPDNGGEEVIPPFD